MRIPLLAVLLLALASVARADPGFRLASPDFAAGGFIPARFTADGADVPPRIEFAGIPAGTRSLALIVEDPDAPSGNFTHWIAWNIPPGAKSLSDEKIAEGSNDFGRIGYGGPQPPSGTHRYFFRLSALNIVLQLPTGATRQELDAAMRGHVIATAELMGRYSAGGSH
jgi:Raf kinase inhibitor-like YbhB/YbcL family protein